MRSAAFLAVSMALGLTAFLLSRRSSAAAYESVSSYSPEYAAEIPNPPMFDWQFSDSSGGELIPVPLDNPAPRYGTINEYVQASMENSAFSLPSFSDFLSAPTLSVPLRETVTSAPIIQSINANMNVAAFMSVIRTIETQNRYDIISGNDFFSDFSHHPFERGIDDDALDTTRRQPAGTTASGAYQLVRKTWQTPKHALGLRDFSPASQDAACSWILQNKSGVKRAYPYIVAGDFAQAVQYCRSEWEAFDRIAKGKYGGWNNEKIAALFVNNGGIIA